MLKRHRMSKLFKRRPRSGRGKGFIQKELMGRQHWNRYLQACCKSGGRGGVNLKRRKCLMGNSSANRNVERTKVSCFYLDQTLLCDQHTASPLSLNMTVAQRVRHCCPTFTGERWCSEAKWFSPRCTCIQEWDCMLSKYLKKTSNSVNWLLVNSSFFL